MTRYVKADSFAVRSVSGGLLPFTTNSPVPRTDSATHDSQGVRMRRVGGKLYDYPGAQARYGLANLNTYRLTGDRFYLLRAEAQAQRLVDTHVTCGTAWYFPERYERGRHSQSLSDPMKPPWYSGMAAGQAMDLFVRLYEATSTSSWLDAARSTLYSYAYPGPAARPWTVSIDGSHHFWIQEWPKTPLDYTFNGHMISSFGLYDYYRVTHDTFALLMFRAAATTALEYAPKFRRPGSVSVYCLLHRVPNVHYHHVHIGCLLQYYTLTTDPAFARLADEFMSDYPNSALAGKDAHLAPGIYTATEYDAGGRLVSARRVTVAAAMSVRVTQRRRVGGVIRLLTTTGPSSGSWLAERPGKVYVLGSCDVLPYDPERAVTLSAGVTYTGRRFADDGSVLGSLTSSLSSPELAHVRSQGIVNGRDRVRVTDGSFAGYWLPLKGLRLR